MKNGVAPFLLLLLGLAQMTGNLTGCLPLSGIGAATAASPAPKVFTAVRGLETFSSRFYLEWESASGEAHSVELTPERYARIRGPYNRRNVYGAALAYGPVLGDNERTRPMFEAVTAYALCGEAPLLGELGIVRDATAGPLRVRYRAVPGSDPAGLPLSIPVRCQVADE